MGSNLEIWIGLAHVHSNDEQSALGKVTNAYVNIMAYAQSVSDFENQSKAALSECGLSLLDIEDNEPLAKRLEEFEVDDQIIALSEKVEQTRAVQFGTFHAYED